MLYLIRLVPFKALKCFYMMISCIFVISLRFSLMNATSKPKIVYTNYYCESPPVATCFKIECAFLSLPPRLFANLPFLGEVNISCGLETLPMDMFTNSTKITNLSMKHNLLTTLPKNLLNDQHDLLYLDLSHNRLQSLPDTLFHNTKNLLVLKLSHNQLVEISNELFNALTNLERLRLDNNNLVRIGFNAYRDTINLKFLSLENNQIDLADDDGTIDNMTSPFRFLLKIEELVLRNNSIKYLHRDWKTKLIAMKKLDLSFNNVRALHIHDIFHFFLSKSLAEVNLTHNLIREINFDGFDEMENFLNDSPPLCFHLNDNQLHCNCVLSNFLKFVLGELKNILRNKIIISANKLVCLTPPLLRGKRVIDLKYTELGCPLDSQYMQNNAIYWLGLLVCIICVFIICRQYERRPRDPRNDLIRVVHARRIRRVGAR